MRLILHKESDYLILPADSVYVLNERIAYLEDKVTDMENKVAHMDKAVAELLEHIDSMQSTEFHKSSSKGQDRIASSKKGAGLESL
jgi:uncharacterized coiled-coil protein SlyX